VKTLLPSKSKKIKPVLNQLAILYRQHYGARLKYLILYGSFSRGDFNADSDIDILVVLDKVPSFYKENETLISIKLDLILEYDIFISTTPVSLDQYEHSVFPFYKNVKKEGFYL